MKKKIVAALLAVGMTASIGISVVATETKVYEETQTEDDLVAVCIADLQDTEQFLDIAESDYFYKEVLWGAQQGIVSGLSADKFGPFVSCTRGQIATFLWRAQGKQLVEDTKLSFTDVKTSAYYYDAVVWAVDKGIISGYNKETFAPEDICTRAQLVTILHRLAGTPKTDYQNMQFEDVVKGAYYYDAVSWAVEQKIANGYSVKTFGSDDKILRCDTVKLLYGFYQHIEEDYNPSVTPEKDPEAIPTQDPEKDPEVTPTEEPEKDPEKDPEATPTKEPEKDTEVLPTQEPDKTPLATPAETPEVVPTKVPEDIGESNDSSKDEGLDKEDGNNPDKDSNIHDDKEQEPELSEVDKAFPWNQELAKEVTDVARTYLEHANDFRYKAGYGAFNQTYIDNEDGKGLIDCSTFLGLVLRGIPYEESRYVTHNIWNNKARTDLYGWADSGLDRDNVRWAYEYADYYIEEERTFEDLSSLKPADLMIHYKKDAVTGEESAWHVSMVLEIEEDGDLICIHSLYGKADAGILTFPLKNWTLDKLGRTVGVRPDYAKLDKDYIEYYTYPWAISKEE